MSSFYYSQSVKKAKHKSRQKLTIFLALTMLCSAGLGFAGGLFATRIAESDGGNSTQLTAVPVAQKIGAGQGSYAAEVAAKTMDSVVEIRTESITMGNRMMGQYISKGAGSGVIISKDGKIVTNAHVIDGASKITVRTRDGKEHNASLLGSDAKTDLAVLKVEANNLVPATYGVSSTLVVGEPVLAIGNPLGELGGTVTDGIISALGRQIEVDGQTMTLLQTNASINPGNSGGGLFDAEGKLVGIVNAKSSGSGIEGLGFAIPIDSAIPVVEQLIENGYVTGRVDVGMTFMDVNEQAAYLYRLGSAGVYVSGVTYGGSAANAGIQRGDRIVTFDGASVKSASEIDTILSKHRVGDKVSLTIERNGKKKTVSMKLGEQRPASSAF